MRDQVDKKPVLVTGAAGFIGSHVVEHLLKKGYPVVALDDLSGGFRDNVPAKAEFVEGSILDRTLLRKLFDAHRFGSVFHLAAYAAEGLSHFIRHFNYQNNLIGSVNLVNLAVEFKIERFVFTSSIAVYGAGQVPMREDMKPAPEDPYGVAKYAIEMDLKSAHEQFGLAYTIFRPHNVYGERQNIGDRYRNVIGIFMNNIMQGQPLAVFGDGNQTRGFSYIDDVAIPIAACIELPETNGETFNIGADTAYTVNELAKLTMKVLGKEVDIVHLDPRNEVVHAYADHSKVKKFFSGVPVRSLGLEEGLVRMAEWAKAHGPRKSKLFMDIEIWDKMPPSWKKELESAQGK